MRAFAASFYDVSPIMVHYKESRTPLYHFLTGAPALLRPWAPVWPAPLSADKFSPVQPSAEVCAIVGGAVTVTGMIDSFIYRSHQTILKKMRIGKLG